jgi:hypothetical protein
MNDPGRYFSLLHFQSYPIAKNEMQKKDILLLWQRGLVVSSPRATEETGATGHEIESRHFVKKFDYID